MARLVVVLARLSVVKKACNDAVFPIAGKGGPRVGGADIDRLPGGLIVLPDVDGG